MSFWFILSRTSKINENGVGDLHSTDLEFWAKLAEEKPVNGVCTQTFGTRGDAYLLIDLLGFEFEKYVNSFAPDAVVCAWGKRLTSINKHLQCEYVGNLAYIFIKLGERGIGLWLSW